MDFLISKLICNIQNVYNSKSATKIAHFTEIQLLGRSIICKDTQYMMKCLQNGLYGYYMTKKKKKQL